MADVDEPEYDAERLRYHKVVLMADADVDFPKVKLSDDPAVLKRVNDSRQRIVEAVESGQPIYGVSTLYGGMANTIVPEAQLRELNIRLRQTQAEEPKG